MSELDKEFIRQKIKLADEYLLEMKKFLQVDDEMIVADLKNRYSLERVFLLLVEEMIDINNYFIKELNLNPVDDLKSSFIVLGEFGILPLDFAQKIAPLGGVRNILIHQYEKIDFNLFLAKLRQNISDFEEYLKHILLFIESKK